MADTAGPFQTNAGVTNAVAGATSTGQYAPSELIEYGSIAEMTEAGSGSTTFDGSSYS